MNWQIRAKQFLQDKLSEEQVEDLRAFCEDMPKQPAFGLVETGGAEFIWTIEKVKQLLLDSPPSLADPNLLSRVKDKFSLIEILKTKVKQDLRELDDPKLLNELVRELEAMETFNFKLEIQKLQEKIALLAEVKNIIKNESRINQSVELLEHINRRVTELSCPERNPGKPQYRPKCSVLN